MVDNIETRCPECGNQVKVSTHDQATGYDCPQCGYSIY